MTASGEDAPATPPPALTAPAAQSLYDRLVTAISQGSPVSELERVTDYERAHAEIETINVKNATVAARNETIKLHNEGTERYYKLRDRWSAFLIWLLCISVGFQILLIVLVGCGALPFKPHEVFLNTIGGELFLQVVGMCFVAVRCLFPSGDPKSAEKQAAKDSKKGAKGARRTAAKAVKKTAKPTANPPA